MENKQNDFSSKSKKWIVLICLSIYFSILFIEYILKNGFIIDDWSIILYGLRSKSYIETVESWFPVLFFRPLNSFCISISYFFKQNAILYNLINLFMYISSFIVLGVCLRKILGSYFLPIFILLSFTPLISSTWIFSSATFWGQNLSILLWSTSLLLITKYVDNMRVIYYVLSFFLLLCSWLIYDIVAFLLLLNILIPFYLYFKNNNFSYPRIKKFLVIYALPVFSIVVFILLYQKIVVPMLGGLNVSRLSLESPIIRITMATGAFLLAVFVEFPILLFESFSHLTTIQFIQAFILLILIIIIANNISLENINKQLSPVKKYLVLGLILIFFSNILLFALSKRGVYIGSYGNRTFHSTWITLIIIIALLADYWIGTRKIYIIYTFIWLLSVSFIVHRDKFIESYQIQDIILKDCVSTVMKTDGFLKGDLIVGNIPHYPPNHFNNEEIFNRYWDWGGALNIRSNGFIGGGSPLTLEKIENDKVSLKKDSIFIDDWQSSVTSLWYYQYELKTRQSRFFKVRDADHMNSIVVNLIPRENINQPKIPLHNDINKIIRNNKIIKYLLDKGYGK